MCNPTRPKRRADEQSSATPVRRHSRHTHRAIRCTPQAGAMPVMTRKVSVRLYNLSFMDNQTAEAVLVPVSSKEFPSSCGQLFGDYFAAKRGSFRKNDLIDARARRLFETTAFACEHNAYPFQI